MKIYTKAGDKGTTGLIGGTRVPKDHLRVGTYGAVDEVNSFIGLAMTTLARDGELYLELQTLQHLLFDLGADLATDKVEKATRITENHVNWLEQLIDKHTATLEPLRSFILPGGDEVGAHLHVARATARRAEREIARLISEEVVSEYALAFVNRLSDYLFTVARVAAHQANVPEHAYDSNHSLIE